MNETRSYKAIIPVIAVLLFGVAVVCWLMGCSGSEEKPASAESETLSASMDVPASASSSASGASSESISEAVESSSSSAGVDDEDEADAPSSSSNSLSSSHEVPGFTALSQYPELPNGCEITSLAAVLNYLDYPVDKGTLSDGYLPKAPVGQANFYEEFVGNPRDSDAYGCYSPVIVATANSYLSSVGSSMAARDLAGSSPSELYDLVDSGKPVIVWATRYMEPGHYSVTWNVNGQDMTWYTPEHCLVLVGYDTSDDTVQLADPMEGAIVSYDRSLFEQRYAELKNQAVVIE